MTIGEWSAASARESAQRLAELLRSEEGRAPAANANGELVITIAGTPTPIEDFVGKIVRDRIDCEDAIRSIAAHYFRLSPRWPPEAITWGDVWSQRVIKAVTGDADHHIEFLRDDGPDPDASSPENPLAKLVGDVVEAFRDKVGRRTRSTIEDSIEFALCQANGNTIHEAAKLVHEAREIMSVADIAKCITQKASNLPWRVSGTDSWTPRNFVRLFLQGMLGDDDVLGEIRRIMPDIDVAFYPDPGQTTIRGR